MLLTGHRDASLACCGYLTNVFIKKATATLPILEQLLLQQARRIRVLELGAGCGVVGIALVQLRKCEVVLTDLGDAQSILQTNLDCATPAAGSSLRRQVLGWGLGLDQLSSPKFDLVLVSDCIYNPDSSVLLVETLTDLASQNPAVLIFVAYKRRHDADDVFFQKMKENNFVVAEADSIAVPHTMTDHDTSEPRVETFVYKLMPQEQPKT